MTLMMGPGIAHDQRPQSTGSNALPGASLSGVDVPGTSGRALPLALGVCDVILQWKCHEVPTAPCPTTDAPSIGFNFTITPNGSPRCKFEGQVDGKSFLWYNCTQKGICECNILSMLSGATETCNREEETPKDVTDTLKIIPLNTTGLHTLRGEMMCQWEDTRRFYGSWYFYVNKTKALCFDSKNGKWTPLNSTSGLIIDNARHIIDTLNRHKDLIGYLLRKPSEICKSWYEKVWNHEDNALSTAAPVTSGPTTKRPTSASGPTTGPSTSASATDQSKNVNITLILGITFIVIVFIC